MKKIPLVKNSELFPSLRQVDLPRLEHPECPTLLSIDGWLFGWLGFMTYQPDNF